MKSKLAELLLELERMEKSTKLQSIITELTTESLYYFMADLHKEEALFNFEASVKRKATECEIKALNFGFISALEC